MKLSIATTVFVFSALGSSAAFGAQCAAPPEVIEYTIRLEDAVNAQIQASKNLLITEELRQRELLLAALKVVTRQESGSGQQTAMVTKKSTEAAAASNTAQRHALAVADAKERYSATGYDSCGLSTKASAFYEANNASAGKARSTASGTKFKPGQFASPRAWAASAAAGGNTDAETLFGGDAGAAQKYIDFVAGPPVEKPTSGGVSDQIFVLEKNRSDAARSLAVEVMASIAADAASGGARDKLEAMTEHFTGEDGGEKWANTMADQPMRGALLDMARIEAAHISLLAYDIKEASRTELALSGYALARINKILFDTPAAPSPSGDRGSQRASLEGGSR